MQMPVSPQFPPTTSTSLLAPHSTATCIRETLNQHFHHLSNISIVFLHPVSARLGNQGGARELGKKGKEVV